MLAMYHIIIKRFKEPEWPTTNHQVNKSQIFGVENKILINYKRINWTPVEKTLRFIPSQGKK